MTLMQQVKVLQNKKLGGLTFLVAAIGKVYEIKMESISITHNNVDLQFVFHICDYEGNSLDP